MATNDSHTKSKDSNAPATKKRSRWPQRLSNSLENLLALVILISLAYAIPNRTFKQFIAGSVSPATVIAIVLLGETAIKGFRRRTRKLVVLNVVMALLVAPLVGAAYYAVGVTIKDAWSWALKLPVNPKDSVIWARIVVVTAILAVGSVLFWIRLRLRAVYGMTEIIVGVAIALTRTGQVPLNNLMLNAQVAMALLTASIYLVVRGLDNVHQGIYKEPRDRIIVLLTELLRQ